MADKFQNRYRIPSARLQTWDYSSDGAYFITICTKNRTHFFGMIENGKMRLSNIGIIANLMWYEIKHHSKNIELGEFIIMPDHMHGILILDNNMELDNQFGDGLGVQTGHALPLVHAPTLSEPQKSHGQIRYQNQGKNSISSIIGSYKSAVTKHCNRLGFEFGWQTRFYDHIIRDEIAFSNISNYIINNPANWNK